MATQAMNIEPPSDEQIFSQIKSWFVSEKKIPVALRDKFFCMALLALNTSQNRIEIKVNRIYPSYQILAILGGLLSPIFVAVIIAWVMGDFRIQIVKLP